VSHAAWPGMSCLASVEPDELHLAASRESGGRGVVAAAFALLGALEAERGEAGLTTLARRSGLRNATAHRLLGQLIAVGAVEQRARRYALRSVLHRLGSGWEPWRGLREAARVPLPPHLRLRPARSRRGGVARRAALRGGRITGTTSWASWI
jgi:hypothetical protein